MDNLFPVVDVAKIGLMAEKAKADVYSNNIANVHNSNYVARQINFRKLLGAMESVGRLGADGESDFVIQPDSIVDKNPGTTINLDHEVAGMAEAELRYQTIAQAIQKKFGLMDLIIGSKSR